MINSAKSGTAPGFAALNPGYSATVRGDSGHPPHCRSGDDEAGDGKIPVIAIMLLLWAAGMAPALAHGGGDIAAGFTGGGWYTMFCAGQLARTMVCVRLRGL